MKVKLIVTTDIHGYIYPTNYTTPNNVSNFGLARIASAIKELRKSGPCILIDNGDAFQSSPLMAYTLKYKNIENPISLSFNAMGYHLFNLGNHDFNYGQPVLFDFINQSQAHLLTSNIFYEGQPLGQSTIMEVAGKKLGFIGITTHYITHWEQPHHIVGFEFEDAYTHLKKEIAQLKDQVDLVIGVYHGGLERDPQTGEPTEFLTSENQGYDMAHLEGLDLLLTGHQHRSLVEKINGVLVTQSAFKGEEFIVVEIDLESKSIQAQQIQAKNYDPDPEILALFSELENETQGWLDLAVGSIKDHDLLIHDEFEARLHKHPLISFLNQVQLDYTQADVACVALFNGASGFNQSITMRDLVSTYVYPNTLVVKEMTGALLREMIDYSSLYFDVDENNQVKVTDRYAYPKPQHYNYDMFDGVSYTIKASNQAGERILDLRFKGKPIKDDDIFKVVMSNYRAMGGGDYTMVLDAPTLWMGQAEMTEILSEYFLRHSPVQVDHHDNIKVIV